MKLNNISRVRLESIINVLKKSKIHDIDHIRNVYGTKHSNFDENLDFLFLLGIVTKDSNKLELAENENNLQMVVVEQIRSNSNAISKLNDFVSLFNVDSATLQPTEQEKVQYFYERTFLVDLGLVAIRSGSLVITSDSLRSCLITRKLTQKQLDDINEKKKILGNLAEEAALKYELSAANDFGTTIPLSRIQLISQDWANAGYDLVGFNRNDAKLGKHSEIYIEVKSVHINALKFYWSTNEIDTAKRLGDKYFLYLIDVDEVHSSGYDSIIIIQDPYSSLLSEQSGWNRSYESIVFTKGDLDAR